MGTFDLVSEFKPTGDQPQAIRQLLKGYEGGKAFQTLEGVTGSGKTFTMANVIAELDKPALVISHNKTLAAQLYSELKEFFPSNAVEYFVSYYDYYQPEAYIPHTDTFIEKDASINEEIERLRLAATDALINREDVIIVASVSCIYGLGSPEDYRRMMLNMRVGEEFSREDLMRQLVDVQYTRNDLAALPGTFRARGDTLDIFPSYSKEGVRVELFGDTIESLRRIDPLTGKTLQTLDHMSISPAKHFVMPAERIIPAIARIMAEMEARVSELEQQNKLLEAQRLRMRTTYDMEMLREVGYCSGIENYSRPLAGRPAGVRPETLMDFFPPDFLTVIDESHVTLPQVRGMFNGDQARKGTLVEHGFRLPSALDNRPMNYEEFMGTVGRVLFTSATPGPLEKELGGKPIRQVIRPTGILDPTVEVRPLAGQVDDLIEEVRQCAERKERVLVTTLTKKTAEDLSAYLQNIGIRSKYLHSDITALDRVAILRSLRKAEFDCLIGINLLREGLDLPEVSLVAVLDADKEGFLRSETSLIQTAGRAARHLEGRVLLYADRVTNSMKRMIDLTQERRRVQEAYNLANGITPTQIKTAIRESLSQDEKSREVEETIVREAGEDYDVVRVIAEMEREMAEAADALEYERAALLRDQIFDLKKAENPFRGAEPQRKRKPVKYRPGKGRTGGWRKKK